MKSPLVTIGIPLYNAQRFIGLAINSILNQTYTNFELIITDDGSTDKSLSIVKGFKDSRIKLISDGCNRGISYRLNQQVNMAKGKYFFRMDADDIMFPNRIERQINYLKNNPDTDVIGSSVVVIDDDNEIIAYRPAELLDDYKKLFNQILFNHPTVAAKTDFFKKFPYSETLIGVEDADLWIRSFSTSKFYVMHDPVLFYRDPLIFKLKTYKFRIDQKNKLLRGNDFLKENKMLMNKFILENNIKKIVATFLSFIKKDDLLISKRNNVNLPIKQEWRNTLQNCVDGQ